MSLLRIHRSPSRFAAWLAMSALLLLFIAPVISKSLVSTAGRHAMMAPGIAAEPAAKGGEDIVTPPGKEMQHTGHEMSMSPMEMAEMSPLEHARMMQQHPQAMMDDSACGYCVLLAHLPLDLTRLPALWSVLQAARLPDLPLLRPVVARFIPRFFHPRAPPFR